MVCERCFQPVTNPEEHGHRVCPLEPRPSHTVVGDEIPGGVLIKHGICNEDGTPRRYDSKTEIRREAAKRGLVWGGDHATHVPSRGSDKSPHTSRWI